VSLGSGPLTTSACLVKPLVKIQRGSPSPYSIMAIDSDTAFNAACYDGATYISNRMHEQLIDFHKTSGKFRYYFPLIHLVVYRLLEDTSPQLGFDRDDTLPVQLWANEIHKRDGLRGYTYFNYLSAVKYHTVLDII
jgi:hypothetical protein